MVISIGTTFPAAWQYGPEEIEIFRSTVEQVERQFPNCKNLVINTTWFGPQFNSNEWKKLMEVDGPIDNLFLLSVIDPIYWSEDSIAETQKRLQIKKIYRIGMFADSEYEWNFHSFTTAELAPRYNVDDIGLISPDHVFLLYQRKPRLHRVELTKLLIERNLNTHGIITLGSNKNSSYDWSEGQSGPVLTIEDYPSDYKHNGKHDDFDGVPNDLTTLGRLNIWQRHFLNVVSETEFNSWHPRFVTEKTWKPMIGLRPFIIHGQSSIYTWLQKNGFKTFNNHWPHVPCENDTDQHSNVISVIEFLCNKSKSELLDIYKDMLPDLLYNQQRFFEFAQEQKFRMNNLFHVNS
jgi:hypothetical protein